MGVPSEKLNNALESIEAGVERVEEIARHDGVTCSRDVVDRLYAAATKMMFLQTAITRGLCRCRDMDCDGCHPITSEDED